MEFSAALAKADPQIQIIDPARLKVLAAERHLLPSDVFNSEVARQLSTSLGAAAQFRGIIKSSGSSLKLDLELVDAVGRLKYDGHGGFNPERLGKSSATLVQSSELTSQLSRANSEDTSGFLIAGTPGTTYATCGDCPPPQFEREAGHDIPEGLVLILITVTPDGKVVDPFILGGGAAGLETATIEAIKKWRFIPARDANGRPGTMRMEIGLRHTR